MPMERSRRNFYFWILITTLTLAHWVVECDKLEGYSFPVYNTTSCPSNQSEWRNRSSDLNCTESNGYMCIPNENITQLLEFCYRYPRIPVEKSICLILKKSTSLVEAYSCKHFRNGCPDKLYWSNQVFEYPSCLSIGHRCFLDEPLCKDEGIATTTLGSTPIPDIDGSNRWVWILVLGIFLLIVFILFFALIIIFKRGDQKTLDEGHKEAETIPHKMDSSGEGEDFNIEEIPLIEYEEEIQESEGNQELNDESILLPANTKTLDKDNIFGDQSTIEMNRKQFKEDIGEKKPEDNSLSDFVVEKQDNMPYIDETSNAADSPSEDISKEEYSSSNKDVLEEINSYLGQQEGSDRADAEKLKIDKIDIEKTEEEGGEWKFNEESLKNDKGEKHDNTLHLDETNKTAHSSSEDNREKDYFSLDEEPPEGIGIDSKQYEDSDRIILEELRRAGIYLDGYEIWETEMSEKYKQLSTEERAALFLLLCSDKNTLILENTKPIKKTFYEVCGTKYDSKNITENIQALQLKGFVSIEKEKVTFTSDCVQDETMFDYLLTCWEKRKDDDQDKDITRQLLNVSLESSLKYFRSGNFDGKGKFVRCFDTSKVFKNHWITIKNTKYEALFTRIISKLGREILIQDILDDKSLHSTITDQLKIPEEVLQWDLDARRRYLEYLKKGKTPIYRARGMIVGCAGAGKTTLLERLQRKSMEDIQKIKSTVGLDVHNDIFEVQEKEGDNPTGSIIHTYEINEYISTQHIVVRKCEPAIHIKENVPIDDAEKIEGKKLLSILDFGGQCMYYACHQIYLSKRAFYILVVDMSKDLEDVIDEELCDQKDTMFSKWSHRDYLLFWLKSVNCYCGDEAPVILVATHAEGKSEQEKTEYYQRLIETFPVSSTIKTHLSSDRFFTLSLKEHDISCVESLDELERNILEVLKSQKHWGEEIPLDWAIFEKFISEKKEKKLEKLDKLKESFDEVLFLSRQEFKDLLRFYHDIGVILYFSFKKPRRNDEKLFQILRRNDYQPYSGPEIVILDIQWFVNSFKYVMTDSQQASFKKVIDAAPTREALDTFKATGEISGTFLKAIWTVTKNQTALEYKDEMIKYMERLGLMAIEEKSDICFIPSMNRMKVPEHVKSKIHSCLYTSPTLYFRFTVLPVFLFYRLIVLCLKSQWESLMDGRKCIYIDTAMFYYKKHVLVLGVSESYIQLMLYNDDDLMQEESIQRAFSDVKREVMAILSSLTKTFNSTLHYEVGYSCTPTEFGKDLESTFITENVLFKYNGKKCPLHAHAEDHDIRALSVFLVRQEALDPSVPEFQFPISVAI
ncbi:uncharacterized protein LOC134276459 [Saccostrea cucullata]|uniref:uncharacterized protein LOC134276459 n=1 Tax=Saccostrea cuccullata TaxID=36930 RepID=UPI002ED097D8